MNLKPGAAVCVAMVLAPMPAAAADPSSFPDVSGYAPVNEADYQSYHAYMTNAAQFVTPAGYRCRMSFTHKQNGGQLECWGALPGTTNNFVGVRFLSGVDRVDTAFANVDLPDMDVVPPGPGVSGSTLGPQDYKLLPAHHKLIYDDGPMQTCAVDESMTACEVTAGGQQHGFVLSPSGSTTF